MIKTNRINYELNVESINRDFFLIAFSSSEKDTKGRSVYLKYADFYDALEVEVGVAGLVFNGKFGYILADRKVVSPKKLLETLRKTEYLNYLEFNEGRVVADQINARKDDLFGYWVVQLLLDSLGYRQMKIEKYQFSNLSSALYLVPYVPKNAKFLEGWKVSFNKNQSLTIAKTRFIKVKSIKYIKDNSPLFVLHPGTRTLKCVSRKAVRPEMEVWTQFTSKNSKATASFADLEDPFSEDTRVGIWSSLYPLMERHLSPYMEFSLDPLGTWQPLVDLPYQKRDGKGWISDATLQRAVATVQSVALESLVPGNSLLNFLERHLRSAGFTINSSSPLKISIVPDPESLKEDEKDPYEWAEGVQHIIQENVHNLLLKEKENANGLNSGIGVVISNLVIETAVKKDIMEGFLSFAPELTLQESYRVGRFMYENSEWNTEDGNYHKTLKRICVMDIEPSGKITFTEMLPQNTFDRVSQEWVRYETAFRAVASKDFYNETGIGVWQVDGFIENSKKEITLIVKTDYHTLPDLEKWEETARKIAAKLPQEMQTISGMITVLSGTTDPGLLKVREFFKEGVAGICKAPEFEEAKIVKKAKLQQWLENIQIDPDATMDKETLRQIIGCRFGSKSNERKAVVTLLETKGVLFSISRSNTNKETLLSAKIGLKICKKRVLGRDSLYYYTGWPIQQGIKTIFQRASIVRLAWPIGDHPPFFIGLEKTFLPWIRADESTVLPGAFKYVREYMKRFKE